MVPKIKAQYNATKSEQRAEIFEGVKGFKAFYYLSLKECAKGEEICIMGVPRECNERFDKFFMEWNKQRIRAGIKLRIIYNHNCREFGAKRERLPLTRVEYMRQGLETPTWVFVRNCQVALISAHEEPLCFAIRSDVTAESYKKYFEIMWKQAEK